MAEITDTKYIPWPYSKEQKICVNIYQGENPVVLPHRHDFIELVIIGNGACSHTYNKVNMPLVPGDVFTVFPHEEHSYQFDTDHSNVVIYNCLFYAEALGDDWKSIKEIDGIFNFLMVEPSYRMEAGKQELLHLNPSEFLYIKKLLEHMLTEQSSSSKCKALILKADLLLILVFLGRIWDHQFKHQIKEYENKRILLKETLTYIESNLQEELNIVNLAAKVYVSPHYFRKIFKECTGLTPMEYINRNRIEKSIHFLHEGNHNISEIAEIVGIGDPNYFARMFRRMIGCTPSEYKRSYTESVISMKETVEER